MSCHFLIRQNFNCSFYSHTVPKRAERERERERERDRKREEERKKEREIKNENNWSLFLLVARRVIIFWNINICRNDIILSISFQKGKMKNIL